MPVCLRVAMEVAHFAGVVVIEPVAKLLEVIGVVGRRYTDQIEAKGTRLLLEAVFE
jgi:hypothetical protein